MTRKPTAWLKELPPEDGNGMMMTIIEEVAKEWEEPVIPLYSKGDWSGLTYEEQEEIVLSAYSIRDAINKTDLKLKEKNT
jgi:hypothetical protein